MHTVPPYGAVVLLSCCGALSVCRIVLSFQPFAARNQWHQFVVVAVSCELPGWVGSTSCVLPIASASLHSQQPAPEGSPSHPMLPSTHHSQLGRKAGSLFANAAGLRQHCTEPGVAELTCCCVLLHATHTVADDPIGLDQVRPTLAVAHNIHRHLTH